jgi:2-polyprenyl-6-hydroxyphenyl methylase/3-demethylubiquinone-9 3-methyltransferase
LAIKSGAPETMGRASDHGVDNAVYERDADKWRDPDHFLSVLAAAAAPRAEYAHRVVAARIGGHVAGLQLLDVGCGGGLVAEELARRGYRVSGVDPSPQSIRAAQVHARRERVDVSYLPAAGEALPFSASTFDAVTCLDVLEHVDDLDVVLGEIARVLKPGGVFVFDTINRTWVSWIVAIKVMQDWALTRFAPPGLHAWKKFITPAELVSRLVHVGLEPGEVVGMELGRPLPLLRLLLKRRRGSASFSDIGSYVSTHLRFGGTRSVSYAGFAVKRSESR